LTKINCADVSVLIIDDQKISRELINQNLLSMGFALIDMAASSAEAEVKMVAKKYDIIFVDWLMPGKSGFALMQGCRETRDFDHVAFIMVTAKSGERDMAEALKAGATSYICKPTLPKEFQPKVQVALEWMAKVNPRFKATS
jgi:two-component system phosphate regulon response regulator PhoB